MANTQAIDHVLRQRVTGVFLTQMLPFFDPKAITLFRAYEAAVYQAL